MNQKTLVITTASATMFVALIATVVAFGTTPLAFAQVTNEGIEEDDDTTNISKTPTKIKDYAGCNISGFSNECDIHSGAGIGFEDYLETLDQLDREK
jgi:hypothetical protein